MMENITAQVEASPAEDEGSSGGFFVSRDDGSSHYSNGNGYNRAPLTDGDFCRCWHNKSLISFVKLQVLAMVKAQPIATVLSISQNDVSIPATIVPVPLVQLS